MGGKAFKRILACSGVVAMVAQNDFVLLYCLKHFI